MEAVTHRLTWRRLEPNTSLLELFLDEDIPELRRAEAFVGSCSIRRC